MEEDSFTAVKNQKITYPFSDKYHENKLITSSEIIQKGTYLQAPQKMEINAILLSKFLSVNIYFPGYK